MMDAGGARLKLVVVPGFPGNESMSRGLIAFLNDTFDVSFVNYPGFHPSVPSNGRLTVTAAARFLEDRLSRLDDAPYVLAGISAGFLVVSAARLDARCLAILAAAPMLGPAYLQASRRWRLASLTLLRAATRLHLEPVLWCQPIFRRLAGVALGPRWLSSARHLRAEVRPEAFCSLALALLTYRGPVRFQERPHALLINPVDGSIDARATIQAFRHGLPAPWLHVVHTNVPHHPEQTTPAYFRQAMSRGEMQSMLGYFTQFCV